MKPINFTLNENIFLVITPIFIGKNNVNETIELPRNIYIEFKLNTDKLINLIKPSDVYKNVKFEIGNKDMFNISIDENKINNITEENNFGKYNYYLYDDSNNYTISIKKNKRDENILLKYETKTFNSKSFIESNYTVDINSVDQEFNSTFIITFNNIYNILNDNKTNYKITYIILLYNYLYFEKDNEINDILATIKTDNFFRKQLSENEFENETLEYEITFGNKSYGEYSIKCLAEVSYNDSIEYFSYIYDSFTYYPIKPISFDSTWIIILIFILLVFIILILYLVKAFIENKKEKRKEGNKESLLENRIEMSE